MEREPLENSLHGLQELVKYKHAHLVVRVVLGR